MTPDHPAEDDGELLITKQSGLFMIPQALAEEMQENYGDMGGISDWLGKALRGEIEPRPPVKPPWHRCALCWLISLLPGHDRCEHGRLGCDDCLGDY
jgi:hypothetical protein